MQSDERIVAALSALGPQIALFRFAVSGTLERARETLASESAPSQAGVALGDFAGGRIDPERFAMVSSGSAPLEVIGRAVVRRAAEVLESLQCAADEEFVVDVRPGTSPAQAIRSRMATFGAAFGAASMVERVRRRTYDFVQHGLPSEGHPFEKWTAGERKVAPPLVIRLDGRDLDVSEFAPLIDGCVRFILVVSEPCAPAPLARLISPGVFVAQAGDVKVLDQLTDFEGPAVIALMNGAEARFVHDPRAGSAVWQRIQVSYMPEAGPRKSLGYRSAWQQRDDLSHLKALIEQPVPPANAADALVGTADATDKITAWLIGQAGLQSDTT